MSENSVYRIDLEALTENDDLIDNDYERFSVEDLVKNSSTVDKDLIPKDFTVDEDLIVIDSDDSLTDDFNLTRNITGAQLKLLFDTLKVAYSKYHTNPTEENINAILIIIDSIERVKRSIMGTHKDLASVTNSNARSTSIHATGTVNIQQNYSGTTDQLLEQVGDALDVVSYQDDLEDIKEAMDVNSNKT